MTAALERPQPPKPDADLLATWHRAVDSWQSRATGATSSITGGGAIGVLEEEFSSRLAGRSCLAVASGTAALAACLVGVGVQPGDEVVTAALDWPAATQAIRWVGARAVYADIDPTCLTVSPDAVARAITMKTRAVIATHLLGVPADVPAITVAADGRPVVEDCAQALGGTLDGRAVGTLADAAAFSLGPGKDVDAGEGGMAVLADDADWQRAMRATQHPLRCRGLEADEPPTSVPGRMHPFAAVLALDALPRLDPMLQERRAGVLRWRRTHPAARVIGADERRDPSWWQVAVDRSTAGPVLPLPCGLAARACPSNAYPNATAALHEIGVLKVVRER